MYRMLIFEVISLVITLFLVFAALMGLGALFGIRINVQRKKKDEE